MQRKVIFLRVPGQPYRCMKAAPVLGGQPSLVSKKYRDTNELSTDCGHRLLGGDVNR